MNKLITTLLFLSGVFDSGAQCITGYTYAGGATDTLHFTNLSGVSNAHYYWNFGDGSGSNEINPVHIYPDNGKYHVTLYGRDTVSNCASFYEEWISVLKPDTINCNVMFNDTIIGSSLININQSTGCAGLSLNCNVLGPGQHYCGPDDLDSLWGASLFLHGMEAYTQDSINGYTILKGFYKTVPYLFTSAMNYGDCSSNFEIVIDYKATKALVTLTAMNKSGVDTFWVTGFGNSLPLTGHSVSYLYPYIFYHRNTPWTIFHEKTDTINGCKTRVTQQILIRNPYYTIPANCSTSKLPQSQTVVVGSDVQFIISTSPYAEKQWQQDAGLGFVNLSDAGPYSGVHTDTLRVASAQLIMNNYHFRCVISGDTSGCHSTLPFAILTVHPVGIDEKLLENIKIYPNPASDYLAFSLPLSSGNVEMKIYNLLGALEIYSLLHRESKIDIAGLPGGVYFIEFSEGDKTSRQKFIKE